MATNPLSSDIIRLSPNTNLVSLRWLSRVMGFSPSGITEFVGVLGVSVWKHPESGVEYVLQESLSWQMWLLLGPKLECGARAEVMGWFNAMNLHASRTTIMARLEELGAQLVKGAMGVAKHKKPRGAPVPARKGKQKG